MLGKNTSFSRPCFSQPLHHSISEAFFPFTASGIPPPRPISTSFRPFYSLPETQFVSRESFETLLRRLTLKECKNVRWSVGSVVGVLRAEGDAGRIGTVDIRGVGEDGVETFQEAALVVGTYMLLCRTVLT